MQDVFFRMKVDSRTEEHPPLKRRQKRLNLIDCNGDNVHKITFADTVASNRFESLKIKLNLPREKQLVTGGIMDNSDLG